MLSDRNHQVLFMGGLNMPQTNPRWQMPFSKSKNRNISATGRLILTKFGGDAFWSSGSVQPIKCRDFKNPRWQLAALLKIQKSRYLKKQLDQFQQNLVCLYIMALPTLRAIVLKLVIQQLQFIHNINNDGSKTAKIINR